MQFKKKFEKQKYLKEVVKLIEQAKIQLYKILEKV